MGIKTTNRYGSRFYFNEAAPEVKYPGVTSVVGMLPKPFLQYWSAGMAAELAVDSLDFISRMAERDRDGAVQYIKGAATRYTKLRARIGSDAHDMFERMMNGESIRRVHPDMRPYHDSFAAFLEAVQPELISAENVAWSDTHQYAGSYDAILRVRLDDNGKPSATGDPATLMVDYKTSKNTYPDVALQMSAYENADFIIDPYGRQTPMPDFDGAAVLHITPDETEFTPVRTDEEVFGHFLHLRRTFDWVNGLSKHVLGDDIWSLHDAIVTGTQRRAR